MPERKRRPVIYGLLAEFDTLEGFREAAVAVRQRGYRCMDAYTPFPVEGMSQVFGAHTKNVSFITLLGGLVGGLGGFYMQHWVAAVDYPLNVGGRPWDSFPAWIPITFELTVLGAALFAFLGMLALNGLPKPYHPVFHVPDFVRASRDRFFLCIEAVDPKFEYAATRELLQSLGSIAVSDVPY